MRNFRVPKKFKDCGKGKSAFGSSIKKISSLADEIILKIDEGEQKKPEPNKVELKIPEKKATQKPFKQSFRELGEKTEQKESSKIIESINKKAPALKNRKVKSILKKESSRLSPRDSIVDKLRLLVETIMTPPRKTVGVSGKISSTGTGRTADNRQVDTSSISDPREISAGDVFRGTQPIQSTVISEVNNEVQGGSMESVSSRSNLMSAEEMAGKINDVLKEQAWIKGTNLP